MLTFTRKAYLDRPCSLRDLTDAFELWRLWFNSARQSMPEAIGGRGFIRLEIEVYGFPVFERDALMQAAERSCRERGCALATDPPSATRDALSFAGAWADAEAVDFAASPAGQLAGAIIGTPALQGLCFSLTVVCRAGNRADRCANGYGGDLTLFGVGLSASEVLLKTIYRRARNASQRAIKLKTTWSGEAGFVRALETFSLNRPGRAEAGAGTLAARIRLGEEWNALRPPGTAVAASDQAAFEEARDAFAKLAKSESLFMAAAMERHVTHLIAMLLDYPGTRTPVFFIRRLALCALLAAGFGYLTMHAGSTPQRQLAGAGVGLMVLAAAQIFLVKARRIVRLKKAFSAGLGKLYSGETHPELSGFDGYEGDPHPARFRAETKALGGRHCFDFRINASAVEARWQCFLFDADSTRLSIAYMRGSGQQKQFKQFPSHVILHCSTHFSDGVVLKTSNTTASGYRKLRKTQWVVRYVPGEHDVGALLERHRQVIRRLVDEGHRPIRPVEEPAAFFAESKREFEASRALLTGKTIYTWSDAIRQAFECPRAIYFEPGWPRRDPREE